jgi:large subunit ribosomal protein L21e
MATRIGGLRRKSRQKFSRPRNESGKISLNDFYRKLEAGDRVCLKANPSYHGGLYVPRFHGRTGVVQAKRGQCYEIMIKDRNKEKMLVVHPVHFVKVQ